MKKFLNEVESALYLLDNIPIDSFDGLSRSELRHLIYNPFSEDSPLQIRKIILDDVLDQIPILRIIEYILARLVEQGDLKLTKKDFLPTKMVKDIYQAGFIEENDKKNIKLFREQDFNTIHLAMLIIQESGFTQKEKNKLSLNEIWKEQIVKKNRVGIFSKIFSTFALKIDWADFDDSPFQNKGQVGIAFTLYLLYKYGNTKQSFSFYADKYLNALPGELSDLKEFDYIFPSRKLFKISYNLQTFGTFLEYLNLVNRTFESSDCDAMIEKSRLFDQILFFN